MAMDTLSNIRTLLLNVNKDLAVVSIKTNIIRNKSNITACLTHDLLIVYNSLGCDLTKDHDQVGLGASFTCNFALRILLKAGIKNCIRDLITELVWVTLVHRLGVQLLHITNNEMLETDATSISENSPAC
ncbi:hypothetical protein H5410_011124 [Solanum commersonii]|uniref:Uncharacterized protein n=1 Tax=Solanum commersonii TaxID=4109 RepID=A0A9J6AP29_SOLCO|nr:hypothetical protein H5410_011124 [Solanum commersonii]